MRLAGTFAVLCTIAAAALLIAQEGWRGASPDIATSISLTTYRNIRPISDLQGHWMIHPKIRIISGLAVYRNGLRQLPEIDFHYTTHTGLIEPLGERWGDTDQILVDFEVQQ